MLAALLVWWLTACSQSGVAVPPDGGVAADTAPETAAGAGTATGADTGADTGAETDAAADPGADAAADTASGADVGAEFGSVADAPAAQDSEIAAVADAEPVDEAAPDGAGDAPDVSELEAVAAGDIATAVDAASPVDSAPPTIALALEVSLEPGVEKGLLLVKLVPANLFFSGSMAGEADAISVFTGMQPALPQTFVADVPPGVWVAQALLLGQQGPLAGGVYCVGAQPQSLDTAQASQWPKAVPIAMHKFLGAPTLTGWCQATVAAPGLLAGPFVATPPTKFGGAHHVAAVQDGDRMWVAGSQDGLVSFDLPAPPALPPGILGNWTVHEGSFCNRLVKAGTTVFCSSRAGYLHAFALDPLAAKQTPQLIALPGVATEGLGARDGVLWVAAHQKGLLARSLAAPWTELPVAITPSLGDVWDVAPLGTDHLAVADGAQGLKVLQMTGPTAGQLVASLPLSGRSAFLHVGPGPLLVSALGGGLHAVDVTNPLAPKWMATFVMQEHIFSATQVGDVVLAASGFHVVALEFPKVGQPWRALRAVPSFGYAMDIDAIGPKLVRSAEFTGVRQFTVDAAAMAPGPVLITHPNVSARVVKVGDPIKTSIRVHNAGGTALQISGITFDEVPPSKVATVKLPGNWTIAPGESKTIAIASPKTQKGVLDHRILLASNDTDAPVQSVNVSETTWLQPGDSLPVLNYQDEDMKMISSATLFKGKVGVVMVAAQSCPVAVLGLASAVVDLAEPLAQGKIAIMAINPWDKPGTAGEIAAVKLPFPITYSPLSTSDSHDASQVLDALLGQAGMTGPPMPIVYVVDKYGKIVLSKWSYEAGVVQAAIEQALAVP